MKFSGLAAVAVTTVALSGCGVLQGSGADSGGKAAQAATPAPSATAGSTSGLGSVKDEGDIPDPCTLLTKSDVADLTGREVSRMDDDGQPAGESTRYCQWQQPGGQLDIFLSRTTASDFTTCPAEDSPGLSRNRMAVAAGRSPAYPSGLIVTADRKVSRYQPPSGWG